jgi:Response regulator containing CheY-like receiver, AAA-type ATPase, and DNA-binding domains
MSSILIIDDERAIRNTLSEILQHEGYKIDVAENGEEGFEKFKKNSYDVVLCDIKMPKMDGIEFLEKSREVNPDVPLIMISGHGNIETAVEAVKKGSLRLYFQATRSQPVAHHHSQCHRQNHAGSRNQNAETQNQQGAGDYRRKRTHSKIKDTIAKVAPTDARVLVTGENGVGKELVAKWIHEQSNRCRGPLIEVNCAAIPSELIESELFGHEKGSFTSAVKQRIGKFELANEGTLFLDEVGDMSLDAQAKVLRALQEGTITRVGGDKEIKVNVRVVAATNKNLMEEVEARRFRLDLYHRLGVILIHVPSLNDRRSDIPALVDHFLTNICNEYGTAKKQIAPEAVALLQQHNWTGNIRELRNIVERLVILSDKTITENDVRENVRM